jgi:conjugal transfer pilus assembly protein TraL
MSYKRSLYVVPKTLDAPTRILGLPLDEFLPAMLFLVYFFLSGKTVLFILTPILTVVVIRMIKQGQGSAWLINLCHWYLPKCLMQSFLRKTPASENREYIA